MRRLAISLIAALFAACGGADKKPPQPLTLTITAAGTTPKSATTRSSGELVLVNGDTVPHALQSDPASPCAGLNSGALAAGHTWPTTLPAGPATCGFRDADQPSNAAFQGTIEVLGPGLDPGGGY
jgi:hypothetical protein